MKKLILLCVIAAFGCGDGEYTVGSVCEAVVDGEAVAQGGETSTVWVGCPGCCTGTYIAPTVVLTAAHCGAPDYVGTERASANVVLQVPHPDYNHPHNDIALLFLDREIDRKPARLGAADYGPALVQGYGAQRDGSDGELRAATVQINEFKANPGGIVTSAGSCFGDSGGPLYQNGVHVGVVRSGLVASPTDNRLDSCGLGGVYTPTVKYADWLNSEVSNITWVSRCE